MNFKKVFLTLFVVAVTVTMVAAQLRADDISPMAKKSKTLTGTWDCIITAPDGSTFKAIQTFIEDGNMIVTAAGPPVPALGNPGLGVWTQTGDRDFAWTFLTYDFDSTLQLTGAEKVLATITLSKDGDEFDVTRLVDTSSDVDGNVTASGEGGTVHGKRVQVELIK